MNHLPQSWGRPRNDIYGPYNPTHLPHSHSHQLHTSGDPTTHTQSPIVTGTSVLGLKYSTGVILAADNLASYGSLARFTDVHRLKPFNERAVVGFGGDVSDMQYLDRMMNALDVEENYGGSGNANTQEGGETEGAVGPEMSAKNLHTWLSKVMYRRRTDFNPLWNAILVGGLSPTTNTPTPAGQKQKLEPFLASVDLLGTTFTSPTLATGFGAHLAQPILRRRVPDETAASNLSRADAEAIVKECMKVLFYRDARSMNEYSVCVVDAETGVELRENEVLEGQSWGFADRIRGYGTQVA